MQCILLVILILLKPIEGIIENYDSPSIGLDKWVNYVKSFGFGNYLV